MKTFSVLIGCEYSGVVRDAFARRGWDAWSCDLLPTERPGQHIQGDVLEAITSRPWDLLIVHPPCTHLAVSGARHFAAKRESGVQPEALGFVGKLFAADVPYFALENPISIISSHFRKPDQIIQPWQFGHGETKKTALWLRNLPLLKPTNVVDGREQRIHRMPPSPNRWRERSRTFTGIAEAFAAQWGGHIETQYLIS